VLARVEMRPRAGRVDSRRLTSRVGAGADERAGDVMLASILKGEERSSASLTGE
jgi:hypothetical protein